MNVRRQCDSPLNLREWLLIAAIWLLFFSQEQNTLIQGTVISEILSPWWCGVLPGFILIVWFFLLLVLGKRYYLRRSFYTTAVLAIVPIILIPLLYGSMICHHENLYSLLRSMFFLFGGYFLFLCLISINPRPKVIHVFLRILLIEAGLVFLLITFQVHTGLPNFVTKVSTRYDSVRIPVQILGLEGTLLLCYVSAYLVYEKKGRLKPHFFILFAFLLYYLIFLCKARGYTIIIIILLSVVMIALFRKSHIIFTKVLFLLAVGIILIVSLTPFVQTAVTSLGDNIYSSIIEDIKFGEGTCTRRLDAVAYYGKEFIRTGMIGFGVVDSTDRIGEQKKLASEYSDFSMNDIGMFEIFFRFGFPAVLFVVVVFFRMERDLRKKIPQIPTQYRIQAYAIHLLIILELLTLPFSKAFFFPRYSMFYALLMFYAWQITTIYSNNTRISYGSN